MTKTYCEKIQKVFAKCKNTLKDSFQLEDYEEEGFISLAYLKEVFTNLELNLD
jgi:Ca2+-binding EF-hand superfamily protein